MEHIIKKWERIIEYAWKESDISEVAYEAWLLPLKPYNLVEDKLYIMAPNDLTIQHIQRRLLLFLDIAIAEVLGKRYTIDFVTEKSEENRKRILTPQSSKNLSGSNLNRKYTFETFVVGQNNRFAHGAALAVADMPGEAYNPLYIHGGPGLGKTHLVQAIGHYVAQHQPEKKIIYVTAEMFANEVIETIRRGGAQDMPKLRERYRNCDVFILDDIQFLFNKENTQQEYFHTFNELHAAGKQIIITSDRPPKELVGVSERIVSRCEWGLMADIGVPNYEVRMAILQRAVVEQQVEIGEDVLSYIANHFITNIRELEGALTRLCAYARLTNEKITLEVAERELAYYVSPEVEPEITPQLIMETVAEHYKIPIEQMIAKKRNATVVKPRHVAMYLCRELTDIPLNLIGDSFGKRDHSTVVSACKKMEEQIQKDSQLFSEIEVIRKKISPN